MPDVTPTVQYVIAVAAAITATAAVGTLGIAATMWRNQKRILRTIFGAEQNEAWDGLVEMVLRHREVLEEEGHL
ncbi:hypothetical protein EXE40_08650 [Halorubrum sp. GN11GM_10-3_MGM]|nr:hypothetical protein EXE40_08650 [Halorubrum sp. GN11GM_10-3_MGM]